ncbi:hypothetical protein [Saccharomonospora piscinae]|uniref:hypothetical protein n=1 Tax=Saccharomonospora piscinae TaxID=687388 RepID=UPI0004B36C8E|nr:hypothetical protein [Saccharomonospora piscinae]
MSENDAERCDARRPTQDWEAQACSHPESRTELLDRVLDEALPRYADALARLGR